MNRFLQICTPVLGLAMSGVAYAQSTTPSANGSVQAPSTHVDSGIEASGAAKQQSPAASEGGAPVKLPPAATGQKNADAPGSADNALTNSPKGPGTGGNDATK